MNLLLTSVQVRWMDDYTRRGGGRPDDLNPVLVGMNLGGEKQFTVTLSEPNWHACMKAIQTEELTCRTLGISPMMRAVELKRILRENELYVKVENDGA